MNPHSVALVILLLIPLVGSIAVFSLGSEQGKLAKQVSLFVSLVVLVYTLVVTFSFDTSTGADRFQFQGSWTWIKSFGVHLAFGVDGIALVLVLDGRAARAGRHARVLELARQPRRRRRGRPPRRRAAGR